MKAIFYKFSLLMISLILVTSSVANASTPCCCVGKMNSEVSQDNTSDMPCHDSKDMASKNVDDTDSNNGCEGCECATCVKTSFYNTNIESKEIQFSNIQFFEKETVYSNIYGSLYQPPKQIS